MVRFGEKRRSMLRLFYLPILRRCHG